MTNVAALRDGRLVGTVNAGAQAAGDGYLLVMTSDAVTRTKIVPGAERGWIVDDILVYVTGVTMLHLTIDS